MRIEIKNRSKTSHLSVDDIERLKVEYYSGGKISELILKYNIDINPNSLVSTFPLVKTESIQCQYCKTDMYFIPPSRTSKNRKEYICITCQHKESILGCKCRQCLYRTALDKEDARNKKSLSSKKNKKVLLSIKEYPNAPLFDKTSIKERLYLGALLRAHLHYDCLLIDLNNNSAQNFAPTEEYRDAILTKLIDKNIIILYKVGRNDSVEVLEKYIQGELYDICISDANKDKRELITDLMYPNINNTLYRHQDMLMLQNEIHVNELVEYMMLIVLKFGFRSFLVEERYRILFSQILKKYSLGQTFNFIYAVIRNQAAYSKQKCHEGYIPISNYIYKGILDRYNRAQVFGWNITPFDRIFEAQQTELSKLIDGVFTK